MATRASSTPQKRKTNLPPKRGQIKAQIFDDIFKSVVFTLSKAGGSLEEITGNGGNGGSSTSPTPRLAPTTLIPCKFDQIKVGSLSSFNGDMIVRSS